MTSEQPWMPIPRPTPTLEIRAKLENGSGAGLVVSDLAASATAGSLSPDIRVNSPPLFRHSLSPCPAASALIVGNYVLTERSTDVSNGIAVFQAVHVGTSERFVCRVSGT